MQDLTLYQVADYSQLDDSEVGEKLAAEPARAYTHLEGSDRRWWTVGLETYQHPDCTVNLASVAQDGFTYNYSDLTDGSMSLDLQVSPDGKLLQMGWSTDGTPITGQLVDRSPNGDRISLPWIVESVTTCLPSTEKPAYSAVHICHCKPLPELAIA